MRRWCPGTSSPRTCRGRRPCWRPCPTTCSSDSSPDNLRHATPRTDGMFSGYGVWGAVAFGSNEINPITNPIAYYSGNRCLDKSVCILLVSFNVLIVSIFLFRCSILCCISCCFGIVFVCYTVTNLAVRLQDTNKVFTYLLTYRRSTAH